MNLTTCIMCSQRTPIRGGHVTICKKDGRPINDNAAESKCPLGRFGVVAVKRPPLPIASDDEIAEMFAKDFLGGCGCGGLADYPSGK